MKLEFSVHSVSRHSAPIVAKVGGKDREVMAEVMEVELTAPGSALTLRFDDIEEAEKVFKGKKVTLTIAGVK